MCVNCRAFETEMEARDADEAALEAVKVSPDADVKRLVL